jgi:hypothetical protein
MAIPSPIIRVNAVPQSGPTQWQAFGPWVDNVLINVYSDFDTMFTAFKAGSVDVTDWPVQTGDQGTFCPSPATAAAADYFCTNSESEFGMYAFEINHHASFMGVAQQQVRTKPVAGIVGTPSSGASSCAVGQGQFVINLVNKEVTVAGVAQAIKDTLNIVTAAGPQTATATDSSTNPTGTYNLPVSGCITQGTYTISGSSYGGSVAINLCPNQVCAPNSPGTTVTATIGLTWNSESNAQPSVAGSNIAKAMYHLIAKNRFINGPQLLGGAAYNDIYAPGGQGLIPCLLPGDPSYNSAVSAGNCPTGNVASHLPQNVLDEECAVHPWYTPTGGCHPASAYNLGGGSNIVPWWGADGTFATLGYPSDIDIRAACDFFVAAGFTVFEGAVAAGTCADFVTTAAAGSATAPPCASTTAYTCPRLVSPAGANKQTIFYIRSHAPRKAFGQIAANGVNLLFGTPNHAINNVVSVCAVNYGYLTAQTAGNPGCVPSHYYTITEIFDIVFGQNSPGGVPPGTNFIDDWNFYTLGQSLGSTPDHLWSLRNTRFTGATCAGLPDDFPSDYQLYCNPAYDSLTNAGEFANNLVAANGFFSKAVIEDYRSPSQSSIFTQISQFTALNGWNFQPGNGGSLVQQFGHGFQAGFFSLLNMHQTPGSDQICTTPGSNTPPGCTSDPKFKPGGCGASTCTATSPNNKNLIRRGFSQDVHKLSPFHALTVWDFEVLSQVYDSLLAVNPRTGGSGSQPIDWMTTSHAADGTDFKLRLDTKWHDGQQVTADDVCFSILTFRDVPSDNLGPSVANVNTCKVLSSTEVAVTYLLPSPFNLLNTGGIPIIPAHLWASICSWPGTLHDSTTEPAATVLGASRCHDPAHDPMADGIYVGSADFVCVSPTGHIGGPCTSSGTQDVTLGGTIALKRYTNYMRCCSNVQGTSYQALSWADKNNDGQVNILDIADAALHFGQADSYWAHPIYSANPATGTVDIGDIAFIAAYFDHGVTKPFLPGALIVNAMDPTVDYYDLGNGLYYLATQGAVAAAITTTLSGTTAVAVQGQLLDSSQAATGATGTVTSASGRTTISFAANAAATYVQITVNGQIAATIRFR